MKKILFSLALMSALLVSCEKPENGENNPEPTPEPTPEPEYSISISPSELTFGAEGGEQSVTVTAKYGDDSYYWELRGESDWKEVENEELWYCESAEWCKVTNIEGYDGDILSFIVTSFNSGTTAKECTFTLLNGDKEIELTVTQGIDDSPIIQFSNPDFEKAAIIKADLNVDNKVSEAEAAYLKELDLSEKGLTDLSDIKYFINLTDLNCQENQLTSLDLSNNTALTWLWCSNNQLTSLDVSGCAALEELGCGGNQLTSLDVSNNTALEILSCGDNQFTTLDVSKNTALRWLSCDDNQLTSLDLSNNIALVNLWCEENQLTSLDLRNNFPERPYPTGILDCSKNPLERIILSQKNCLDSDEIDEIIEEYGDIITYVE